ncbi:RNA-dependent RNA polymerase 1 [Madurella mycetomatis]|uniref:RNA-dependent RNA polymerase n=1 Tax=Madurella mycetomatis TaxID=100816 RepID=A0A175VWP5_9PEZI|nr:RNA-dependent RNA polymerase 1 [Madurella mycetomatis]KXX83004.1 RNA-dependent RNA polymerase 1 [Madurella mycetomatis]
MEVWIGRLPEHLNTQTLRSELEPFMERLAIFQYRCEKPRRKGHGFINFQHEADGRKFLDVFGSHMSSNSQREAQQKEKGPDAGPQLIIMGSHVQCSPSRRKPTVFKPVEHKPNIARSDHQNWKKTPFSMAVSRLDCGHCVFLRNQLAFVAEWSHCKDNIRAEFSSHNLILTLPKRGGSGIQVRTAYHSIQELVWSPRGIVILVLHTPPTFLTYETLEGSAPENPNPSIRVTERLKFIDDAHGEISSFCTVYRFQVLNANSLQRKMIILETKGVQVTEYDIQCYHARDVSDLAPYSEAMPSLMNEIRRFGKTGTLPFGTLFYLQALAYNGYLHPDKVSILARKLATIFAEARRFKNQGESQPISNEAIKMLLQWIKYPSPHSTGVQFEVDKIIEYLEDQEKRICDGDNIRAALLTQNTPSLTRVFGITITPTRILLSGLKMEVRNRILRNHDSYTDHFIRAQFCDEDGQDLFSSKVSLDPIYERFRLILREGIFIGGRNYRFLGFSNSSLRSHSAWLLAPFHDGMRLHTSETIIEALSTFEDMDKGLRARFAARVGQTFSETPHTLLLRRYNITHSIIDDVETGTGVTKRVFSDGIGKISEGALKLVHEVIRRDSAICIQIRWAGAKACYLWIRVSQASRSAFAHP